MGKTSIEWTDASWNPIVGCTEISPGCANCYAARLASTRLSTTPAYRDLAVVDHEPLGSGKKRPRWNGQLRFSQKVLNEPLHWKTPRKIFVCDMGDLFHQAADTGWIRSVFDVIVQCPQHTFQILTKRADLMRAFMVTWAPAAARFLPNVWLGVSVENQHFADERIPLLLNTPAAVRWISAEPLLGPLRLVVEQGLNWVVCGGESGSNARPMHPDWARSLRDQCQAVGVPFFFKQWGEWLPRDLHPSSTWKIKRKRNGEYEPSRLASFDPQGTLHLGSIGSAAPGWQFLNRVGKKAAGRLLDGREWNEFPGRP